MGNSTMVDPHGRSDEDRRALKAKLKALNAHAEASWDDQQWHKEMAADMTETIYWGFEHENLLQLFTTVENAGFGDRVSVKEVRGLRAHWLARGGQIEASTLHAEVVELPRDTVGFHVYEMEDKIRTQFGETQAELVDLGIQRLDATVNQRALGLFQSSIPIGSDFYLSASGLSLTVLNKALRDVRDVSMDPMITLVGRSTMTDQIIDQLLGPTVNGVGFLPETNEMLLRMGVLGVYRGARIVTLKNYKDDQEHAFFPANELFVIGRDASKFAFWGGLMSKESVEDLNWYWHFLARRDFGGLIHRPNRMRRIVDTNTPANLNDGGSFTYP